jgi:hypothetical protein
MYELTKNMSKTLSMLLLLSAFALSSCDKDDDKDKDQFELTATANGAQETPAVTTDGTGAMTGSYNKTTNVLTYTVTWTNLSGPALDMHFHGPADPGTPAGVAIAIDGFTSAAAGDFSSTATLTEQQESELLAGKWYYNVHTDLHKGGEIRGQITVK